MEGMYYKSATRAPPIGGRQPQNGKLRSSWRTSLLVEVAVDEPLDEPLSPVPPVPVNMKGALEVVDEITNSAFLSQEHFDAATGQGRFIPRRPQPMDASESTIRVGTSVLGPGSILSSKQDRRRLLSPPEPSELQEDPQSDRSGKPIFQLGRLGIPKPQGDAENGDEARPPEEAPEPGQVAPVRYIHIPDHALEDFQAFARGCASQAKRDMAASNPFVLALQKHRKDLDCYSIIPGHLDAPSLEQQLGTQREALSLLSPTGYRDDCYGQPGRSPGRRDEMRGEESPSVPMEGRSAPSRTVRSAVPEFFSPAQSRGGCFFVTSTLNIHACCEEEDPHLYPTGPVFHIDVAQGTCHEHSPDSARRVTESSATCGHHFLQRPASLQPCALRDRFL